MKKFFKLIMAMALICSVVPAYAQFTGNKSNSGSSSADTESYNRISLSYDNTHLGCNKYLKFMDDEDAMSLNGVGLEYTRGISISKDLPMFVEVGIKAQFGAGSLDDDDDGTMKIQQFSFSVPVNYTYKFAIGDGISIAPYLGVNFKVHAMAREKYEYDDDIEESDWYNIFSKDDMGSKDATWNRFQMGWQLGIGLNVKSFYVGLQYGTDFIAAYKYKKAAVNTGNFALKVGYNF